METLFPECDSLNRPRQETRDEEVVDPALSHEEQDALEQDYVITYTLDLAGNRTRKHMDLPPGPFGENFDQEEDYAYDQRDRLTSEGHSVRNFAKPMPSIMLDKRERELAITKARGDA